MCSINFYVICVVRTIKFLKFRYFICAEENIIVEIPIHNK